MDEYILGITDDHGIINNSGVEGIALTEYNDIKGVLKKRNRDSHKGTYGKVGILSGSKGMAGAAILNCNAALRSGSGLVKAFITDKIYPVVESLSIESITYPFDEDNVCNDELDRELLRFSDVIATGSGCTNLKGYSRMLEYLLEKCEKPLIIDAEGINVLSLGKLKEHKQPIILTPHYGEMSRLVNRDLDYVRKDIIKRAADFVLEHEVYLVLKGPRTLVVCPNGNVYINTNGNPGMATAGSGDVLTGIIASLIGQGIEMTCALRTAVYLHGLAGDIGSTFEGEYSLTAGDMVKYLPQAIIKVMNNWCSL
jgi:NAD(P)H-hydrate epimerase